MKIMRVGRSRCRSISWSQYSFIGFLFIVLYMIALVVQQGYINSSGADVVWAQKRLETGLLRRAECPRARANRFAIVSLLTSPGRGWEYLQACKVLGKSLIMNGNVDCGVDLVVMLPEHLSSDGNLVTSLLGAGWDSIKSFQPIRVPPDVLNQISDLKFRTLFDKLDIFNWVEYDTILYMDSDTLVVDDIMPLFTYHAPRMKVIHCICLPSLWLCVFDLGW